MIKKTELETKFNPNIAISALILSGGQGRRMGYKDKGKLPIKGIALIEIVIAQLQKQIFNQNDEQNRGAKVEYLADNSLEIIISTNQKENYQHLTYPCIDDSPFPSEGPLCAIASGLKKITCDYLLIVPCDCPNIPENLLLMLFSALQNTDKRIASIETKRGLEPLFSLIKVVETNETDNSFVNRLVAQVNGGLRKTQAWIQSESCIVVHDSREDYYSNINRPEDIKDLESSSII